MKPTVVQHCFGQIGNGGPIGALQRLIESDLAKSYNFPVCIQDRPAGGINLPLIFRMAQRIRSLKPDLLHVRGLQNEGFHGLLAGRLAGCPRIVVSVHGSTGDIKYPPSLIRQNIISRMLEPFTLRNADGVFCVSQYASERPFIIRNARLHLGYVHNAVTVPKSSELNRGLRQSLGFTDDDVVAICVCRITKEKGVYDLCDALKLMDEQCNYSLKVLLVGDGPDLPAVREITSTLIKIKVTLLGTRVDVPDLLSLSDLFVFPSLHENLSNALLEAMSFGLPVIATNVGGNPEVVIDGETGILIRPSDPASLARSIRSLLSNKALRKKMGIAGRSRVERNFSMPAYEEKLDKIYKTMLRL